MESTTETITSADGTTIAFERSGSGPPLVLVHGAATDRSTWEGVLPRLAESFTVYAVDRRGRGDSGDADDYSIDREATDIAAVVDNINRPAFLLGHSFGGICSMEAALRTNNLRTLTLYEPPVPVDEGTGVETETIEKIESHLADDDPDAALAVFFEEIVGASRRWVESIKGGSAWEAGLESVHVVPREARATDAYEFDPDRFAALNAPIRLLSGERTDGFLERATEGVASALADGTVETIPGCGHAAMLTARRKFTRTVTDLLLEKE